MNAVHPAFTHILDAIQQQPAVLRLAAYRSMLRRMDWSFEFSDDNRKYVAGRDALAAAREEQRRIDPDGAIWNAERARASENTRLYWPEVAT